MDVIETILKESSVIAVVGLSPNPQRDSHRVAKYMKEQGYRIVPVNPNASEVLEERSYSSLTVIPFPVDSVDIFRCSKYVSELVDEAIKIGAKSIWMQQGIVDPEAARKARKSDLAVVMDRCMMVEHLKLVREGRLTDSEKEEQYLL